MSVEASCTFCWLPLESWSAFFGTDLDFLLRARGIGTLVLAGTTTPNCIRTTCYDALSLDYNVAVIEDCTSSRTPAVQAHSSAAGSTLRRSKSSTARPFSGLPLRTRAAAASSR